MKPICQYFPPSKFSTICYRDIEAATFMKTKIIVFCYCNTLHYAYINTLYYNMQYGSSSMRVLHIALVLYYRKIGLYLAMIRNVLSTIMLWCAYYNYTTLTIPYVPMSIVGLPSLCYCNFFNNFRCKHLTTNFFYITMKPIKCWR